MTLLFFLTFWWDIEFFLDKDNFHPNMLINNMLIFRVKSVYSGKNSVFIYFLRFVSYLIYKYDDVLVWKDFKYNNIY